MAPRTSTRTTTILALGLVVVVVAVGVMIWTAVQPDRRDTLIVGDSVTFLSIPRIQDQLGTANTQIVARPGYRSVDLLPRLRTVLKARSGPSKARDVAIFLVGYNDVSRKTEGQPALPAMVKASNAFRCAVW